MHWLGIVADVAVVLIAARAVGVLCRRIRQPVVVGEIVTGLILGIVLGALPNGLAGDLLPAGGRDVLDWIGKTGLVLFGFAAGLAFDFERAGSKRTVATISLASVLIPFGLGVLLATKLYHEASGPGSSDPDFLPFALFIGTATAITAFPVLARILIDRRMHRSELGVLALACAAVNDVLGWSILATVLAIVASSGGWDLPVMLLESAAFVAALFLVVRRLVLARLVSRYERTGRIDARVVVVALLLLALSAEATEQIGVHMIFGAFLFGAAWPRRSPALLGDLERRLGPATTVLLPVFFVLPGLSIDITTFDTAILRDLALVLFVATMAKVVSTSGAARWAGLRWRNALALGALMNTRGVMELVALNIGLTAGIIDARLYAVFVMMALITTAATGPALSLLYPARRFGHDRVGAELINARPPG